MTAWRPGRAPVSVLALCRLGPARIMVAGPAEPESTCQERAAELEEVICATTPSLFFAVGDHDRGFTQTSHDEVRDLRRAASWSRTTVQAGPGRNCPSSAPALAALDEGERDRQAVLVLVDDGHSCCLVRHPTACTSYETWARMTRWLIEEKGFCAVAAKAGPTPTG